MRPSFRATVLSLATLLLSAVTLASEQPYYSNDEASSIAQCIRTHMQSPSVPRLADLRLEQEWTCQQVMYLWDQNNHVNALIVRDDADQTIFRFVRNEYTDADQMVDNASPLSDDKKRYGFFNHSDNGLAGYFSHVTLGPAPHRQDYLTFGQGLLFWEESVTNGDYNLPYFPALRELPFALFRSHAGTPDRYKQRVTTYGVCYVKGERPASVPCF